jgi:hypothetical protein
MALMVIVLVRVVEVVLVFLVGLLLQALLDRVALEQPHHFLEHLQHMLAVGVEVVEALVELILHQTHTVLMVGVMLVQMAHQTLEVAEAVVVVIVLRVETVAQVL